MTADYRFADITVRITSVCDYIHRMCSKYRADGPVQYHIETTHSDIETERIISARTNLKEGREVQRYSDGYLETLAVYRKIAEAFLADDILLFHGSVVEVDGEAFLFTAKSGTGKSTHTANWRKVFGERAVMINDDKPLIRITDNGAVVYGTPWNGKHHMSTNKSAPLSSICILTRAAENHIEKCSAQDHYGILIQQVYRPKNPAALKKTLELTDRLFDSVSLYLLGCNMEEQSAVVAYNGMKGK